MKLDGYLIEIDKSFSIEIKQRFEIRAVKRGKQGDYEDWLLGSFDTEEQAKNFREWMIKKAIEMAKEKMKEEKKEKGAQQSSQ